MMVTSDAVLAAARKHLRAQRWREAESLAARWLARQPASGDACAVRGLASLAGGNQDDAREWIEMAVLREPRSAFAYLALGQLYLAQGKEEEAESCLRRSLALDEAETEASGLLAMRHMAQGEVKAAENLLRTALSRSPRSVLAHLFLAELLLRLGQMAEAERLLAAGCALDRLCAPLWLVRAQVMMAQGRWMPARDCCEQALLQEPDNPQYLTELARVLLLQVAQPGAGRTVLAEAEQAARQAVALMPKAINGHLILGAVLRAQGRCAEALAVQADMVRMAPQDPMPAMELSLTQRAAGNLDAALVAAERAMSLAPQSAPVLLLYGDTLLLRGELAAAFVVLDRLDAILRPGQERLAAPLTDESVAGRDIVLVAATPHQALLHVRYVPLLAQRGVRVALAVDPSAHCLLQRVPGVEKLLALDTIEPTALAEPITRLPVLLGVGHAVAFWQGPYCIADTDNLAQLRAVLAQKPARRIGVDLGPQPDPALAAAMAAIAREAGATVVALGQMDPVMQAFEGVHLETCAPADLEQLAALVQAMDDIVTVDSLVAHLAGAAGRSCHVLLSWQHDALWGASAGTPWYPGVRCYREHVCDGWGSAVAQLRSAFNLSQESE